MTALHIAVHSRQKRNVAELGFSSRYSERAETDVQSRKKRNYRTSEAREGHQKPGAGPRRTPRASDHSPPDRSRPQVRIASANDAAGPSRPRH